MPIDLLSILSTCGSFKGRIRLQLSMPHVDSGYLDSIDFDQTIFRYMSFSKFANLLKTKELHFHQAARFGDRFEGSVPEIIEEARKLEYERAAEKGELQPEGHEIHAEINKCLRRFTYLSCWHMTNDESVAMWDKYGGSDGAVAIKTTVEEFSSALNTQGSPDIYFGKVDYEPYSSDHESTPEIGQVDIEEDLDDRFFLTREAHSLVPFVYKRKGYEYEHEMRGIIQNPPTDEDLDRTIVEIGDETYKVDYKIQTEAGPLYLDARMENETKGIDVPVYLDGLIQKVHTAPDASDWFKETVEMEVQECEALMRDHSLDEILEDSILDDDPSF